MGLNRAHKFNLENISLRLKNLEKIIPTEVIQMEIITQKLFTENERDALNLAYYSLKDKYSKIQRWRYGIINQVEYERKRDDNPYSTWYYYNYNDLSPVFTSTSTSYTITTSTTNIF